MTIEPRQPVEAWNALSAASAEMPRSAAGSMDDMEAHSPVAVTEWLMSYECRKLTEVELLAGFGERLRQLSLPIDCIALYLRALHPEIRARIVIWQPGAAAQMLHRSHAMQHIVAFPDSPIRAAMETLQWQAVDSDRDALAMNRLEVFRSTGASALLVAPLPGDGRLVSAVAFATRGKTGFAAEERRVLEKILPALDIVCELLHLRRAEASLLDTYVGPATGRRILAGQVRRGDVESLEAALLLCDLRDFTGRSNRLAGAEIIDLLNRYFDQVVPAISANGGEVVKFIGDAVLAFFRSDAGPAASCAAALHAAACIRDRLAGASAAGDVLEAGIALHHGEISYGNIGSGLRLDFTVIGRDVNLLSRIQGSCGPLGQSVLMSAAFAALLEPAECRSVGRFPLKGFTSQIELFAVPPKAA